MLQAHAVGGCMHFGHSNIATDWWAFSWWNWSQKEPTMRFTRTADLQGSNLTTQRLEAFSDGVFAIAITLLILDIRLPEPVHGAQKTLAAALLAIWPSYVAYVLSFVVIGIYWVNHHYIFKLYRHTDHMFNLLNVFFLLCISFLPFPTAVLGKYMLDVTARQAAVTFYTSGLLLPAVAWFLKWLYASHHQRLIDRRLAPEFVRHLTWQYGLSNMLYVTAVIASWINPLAGLVIDAGLAFLYLLPSKPPVYRDQPVS
jgi:uncharacterized membrane protein